MAAKRPVPPPDEGETDLLARYRSGDRQAFRALVEEYQARMLHFFYRLCWDRDRAEDLTQELFIKLLQGSRRYRPQGKLSTYVYRVATNLWIDHYRAARPARRLYSLDQATFPEPVDVPGLDRSPLESASHSEQRAALQRALENLTEPHRLVFELAVYQQRPYAEISELLDIPVGTVKSRMHNAVQALRALLGQAGAEPSNREGDVAAQRDTFPTAARRAGG